MKEYTDLHDEYTSTWKVPNISKNKEQLIAIIDKYEKDNPNKKQKSNS